MQNTKQIKILAEEVSLGFVFQPFYYSFHIFHLRRRVTSKFLSRTEELIIYQHKPACTEVQLFFCFFFLHATNLSPYLFPKSHLRATASKHPRRNDILLIYVTSTCKTNTKYLTNHLLRWGTGPFSGRKKRKREVAAKHQVCCQQKTFKIKIRSKRRNSNKFHGRFPANQGQRDTQRRDRGLSAALQKWGMRNRSAPFPGSGRQNKFFVTCQRITGMLHRQVKN